MSASAPAAAASASARPLLMIPGPIEFHPAVLNAIGLPTLGHVSAGFMEEFGSALGSLRTVFQSGEKSQPFVLAGSGTLGWELVAANLLEIVAPMAAGSSVERSADVLVANSGYFSDSWRDCFEAFGMMVANVQAPIGGTISPAELTEALKANPKVKLVALTQVDTSTAVLNDIKGLAAAARAFNPNILVAVDGVCSFGAERFQQEEWGVDAALTCSQKALGVPPGLCVLVLSPRALTALTERKTRVPVYYGDLRRWLPIMKAYEARTPSYFATPPVNLIRALKVSLDQIVAQGMEARWARHAKVSTAFKSAVQALGLKQVPTDPTHSANTLSAIYFPTGAGITASKLIPSMMSSGIICAGGLHKDIKATYFRVGHMSYSVQEGRDDVRKVVDALEHALKDCGAEVNAGAGIKAFDEAMKQ